MSWIGVLKKNDKEFETTPKNKEPESYEEAIEDDPFIKDADEEFDKKYMNIMIDIKMEFIDFIKDKALPFLNKVNHNKYNFYDFIKEHSIQFREVEKSVDKENEQYFDDLEREEEELIDEYKEFMEIYE